MKLELSKTLRQLKGRHGKQLFEFFKMHQLSYIIWTFEGSVPAYSNLI